LSEALSRGPSTLMGIKECVRGCSEHLHLGPESTARSRFGITQRSLASFIPKECPHSPLIFIAILRKPWFCHYHHRILILISQLYFQMALNNTVWPSTGIAQEAIKEWLSTFYRLADTNNSAATEQMVDLFAEHAVVKTAAGLAQGKAGKLRYLVKTNLHAHFKFVLNAIKDVICRCRVLTSFL
jgi:hypothetical protein